MDEDFVAEALEKVRSADKAVVLIGLPDGWESEGFDRKHLRIPSNQIDLLGRLKATGKPVIACCLQGRRWKCPGLIW